MQGLAEKLRSDLEQMRKHKEIQEAEGKNNSSAARKEEEVLLTRTDRAGNVRPVESAVPREPRGGRRKRQKVTETQEKIFVLSFQLFRFRTVHKVFEHLE